jgi:hypothetical protein
MDGFTSGANGYPQTEQRFRLPSAVNCGEGSELGTVESLTDGFLFCFFLAKRGFPFSNLAGMVKSFLNLFVHLLELAQGLRDFHALILRRSRSRAMLKEFNLSHYQNLPSVRHQNPAVSLGSDPLAGQYNILGSIWVL